MVIEKEHDSPIILLLLIWDGIKEEGIKRVQVAPPPEKQLISPELKTKLDEGEKTTKEKQSHKGFKKTESNTQKKKGEGARQTPIQLRNNGDNIRVYMMGSVNSMPPPLMKMNVAIKHVEVASPPHQKQLLSDCSPQKQSNCSAYKTNAKNNTKFFAVARPIMQKATQSMNDMKRFQSSKRRFEERFAEQMEVS